jgi:ATP-dependent Clp protease ATP-binding subunit ClpB
MTSNLGSDILANHGNNENIPSYVKSEVLNDVKKHFSPEFYNRIDDIIVFNRLSKSSLKSIIDLRLNELQSRLKDRSINLQVADSAKSWLTEHGYEPLYGARPLNRLIKHEVMSPLSKMILEGTVKNGDTVFVDAVGDELRVGCNIK